MSASPVPSTILDDLRTCAASYGFDHLSVASPVISEPHHSGYSNWVRQNQAGAMEYMVRAPEKRLDPSLAYPGVKSILTLAVSYYQGEFPSKPSPAFGRVARYAWGQDYHAVIPQRLEKFLSDIPRMMGRPVHPRVAVDTQPLLERALSASSGLGFIGKNTVLIMPSSSINGRRGFHVGSYVFLTEILLDVELETTLHDELKGCGSCTNCLTACPTKAFRGPYDLDAGRCLAYLTIENKGWISREMRPHLGDWVFGCDICQEVCPFNARAKETLWPEFHASQGVGPFVDLQEILSCAEDAQFKARWGHTPLGRPKRAGMIRNAAIAAGNLKLESSVPALKERTADVNPIVRGHAAWALTQILAPSQWRPMMDSLLKNETDLLVQADLKENLSS